MPTLSEMVEFKSHESVVETSWGVVFLDLLHKALVLSPRTACVKIGEDLHSVVSLDGKWLRLHRPTVDADVLVHVDSIRGATLEEGILRLSVEPRAGGVSTVRQVTL